MCCDAPYGTPWFPFYRPRESMGYSEGKEGPDNPGGLLLLILLFSLHYNLCFPLAYKRESRASHKGHHNTSHQLGLESIEP